MLPITRFDKQFVADCQNTLVVAQFYNVVLGNAFNRAFAIAQSVVHSSRKVPCAVVPFSDVLCHYSQWEALVTDIRNFLLCNRRSRNATRKDQFQPNVANRITRTDQGLAMPF